MITIKIETWKVFQNAFWKRSYLIVRKTLENHRFYSLVQRFYVNYYLTLTYLGTSFDFTCGQNRTTTVVVRKSGNLGLEKLGTSTTVVSPNKGTLKICEIGSNKGIFPLFIRFPYLKYFDEIPQKSPKPRTEIGFTDRSRQL